MDLKISYGNSRFAKKWSNKTTTFEELCERLKNTRRTTETVSEYKRMARDKRDAAKDVGGFVLGHLQGGRRTKRTVECRSGVTLDIDHADRSFVSNVKLECPYKSALYSTHSHTPEEPRLRQIIPTARDMTPEEYAAVSRYVAADLGMDFYDDSTYEPERLMYWPSTPADGEYIFEVLDGQVLDPDKVLAAHPNWRDCSLWPTSSRQSEVVQRDNAKKQEDPLTKSGIVGAFCRTHSIEDVIEEYLSDVYEPSVVEGRYDYIPADSAAGVIVYDGKFAYSHHATDPACGKLLNAFDLVRIHKFGDLAEKESFNAMADFASKDGDVVQMLAEERMEEAKQDFSTEGNKDWLRKLENEPRSTRIKNSLKNMRLIMENDPKLKGIVFNELADAIEIKGNVPWRYPTRRKRKIWRGADDAQLKMYLDECYGTFTDSVFNTVIAKVTDDRAYHPIIDYFETLPEWDGTIRVETMLIDYFGAEDNDYVRAVTRKQLVAAVARIYEPGCKYDYMLVMNGEQGLGKSTLLARLGGEWFNDSMNLEATRDVKQSGELMQGYWIIEFPDMSGFKKTDVDELKSFLSRQDDKYRASYGRRVEEHPRQCVFFGNANSITGYLRDTTGNRRFYPVKTPEQKKNPFFMAKDEVAQIWAEAKRLYEAGESLVLPQSLEAYARREQRLALQADDREGFVLEFLEMLLPDRWDSMDMYQRRQYIEDTDYGYKTNDGINPRTQVCGLEIWCECFGRDKNIYGQREKNEVSAIMARLGWQIRGKRDRIPIYGQQAMYEPPLEKEIGDVALTKQSQQRSRKPSLSVVKGSM